MKQTVAKLLDIADRTVYKWKKEARPIISFLYQYFSKEDMEEYLENGIMSRLEILNKTAPITADEIYAIDTILTKIEKYVNRTKVNREGFLLKLYRTVRDFHGDIDDFLEFLDRYNMETLEPLRNLRFDSSLDDVRGFYADFLSNIEREVLFERKLYVLPPLKAMRRHNAHLKD